MYKNKCPQRVSTKSVQKKRPQKVATKSVQKSVHWNYIQKVSQRRGGGVNQREDWQLIMANERPGKKCHPMSWHTTTKQHTDEHRNFKTELASGPNQWKKILINHIKYRSSLPQAAPPGQHLPLHLPKSLTSGSFTSPCDLSTASPVVSD